LSGRCFGQLDLPLEQDGLQSTSIQMLLSLIEQDPASISSSAAVDQLDRSLPVVELPPPSPNGRGGDATGSAAAVAGEHSQPALMPQQQRGFTALQALVQRGGLAEMQRVLTLRDDDDDGFLTMHDMRAVLTDPTARNQAASATAAGWPTVDGADYRRMAYLRTIVGCRSTGSQRHRRRTTTSAAPS